MCRWSVRALLLACSLCPALASAADFEPDPRSVLRHGPAYRYPQAGWIVLHIEGQPYERGCQHGRLMAPEIAAEIRCMAAMQSPKAPSDGWKHTRTLVDALFVRRYDRELLEEMKGIADGASAAGARHDGRPIDLVDIVAINAWPEIETLPSALQATPTGLEGLRFPLDPPKPPPPSRPMHCSAFAATGPATADGKMILGHITMFHLYPSSFYNVWLDVKPARGHRVCMQSYPGGIQSGLDYYFNDAGLAVCETTIAQTRFDAQGMSVASRIRQALQYADTIEGAVEILRKDNNGLYSNEWLLGDAKTNEIAMFELGTRMSKLYRSKDREWLAGTEGFYWGCNNTKDLEVRLETLASLQDRPGQPVFHPSDRDRKWLQLYDSYKGKMDASFGKLAFTTPPLAAYHSVDAKYTTTDLVKQLKTHALFGPPLGRTWKPTFEERLHFDEIQPLVSNPWTVLHAAAPASCKEKEEIADLHNPEKADTHAAVRFTDRRPPDHHKPPLTLPAWHGTLLPASDADIWLAVAFAEYERIIALENHLLRSSGKDRLSAEDQEKISLALFAHRTNYELGARAQPEKPLAEIHPDFRHDEWYRVAAGKGVLLLHALRQRVGREKFIEVMDSFGKAHAGQKAGIRDLDEYLRQADVVDRSTGEDWLAGWSRETGLPALEVLEANVERRGDGYEVSVKLRRAAHVPLAEVEVTVETSGDEVTEIISLKKQEAKKVIQTKKKPRRVVIDKYRKTPHGNGGPFSVLTFTNELEDALIVYGCRDEVTTNREAALALQQALRARGPNITVSVKDELAVNDEDLKKRHIILIGRPDSNELVARFQKNLPITFGLRSFEAAGKKYAHPGSAIAVAAENPLNRRYSMVVVAGLGAASTLRTAPLLIYRFQEPAEAIVYPHAGSPHPLVLPARDLVRDLTIRKPERASQ